MLSICLTVEMLMMKTEGILFFSYSLSSTQGGQRSDSAGKQMPLRLLDYEDFVQFMWRDCDVVLRLYYFSYTFCLNSLIPSYLICSINTFTLSD